MGLTVQGKIVTECLGKFCRKLKVALKMIQTCHENSNFVQYMYSEHMCGTSALMDKEIFLASPKQDG